MERGLPKRNWKAVVSIDLHETDEPGEIDQALEHLAGTGIRATVFIPTRMLSMRAFRRSLRALGDSGHELGTHGHEHDFREMEALRRCSGTDLGFLRASRESFADFFGRRPTCFRAPCWCRLGAPAHDELSRLGYLVDSSATPQRLGLLSSFPWDNPYLLARRRPYGVGPGLLEVPTSSFLVPFGAPTFHTFRAKASRLFAKLFVLEASLDPGRVVVVQMHAADLVGRTRFEDHPERRWRDIWPAARGGIRARTWIRTRDPREIALACRLVIDELRRGTISTFAEVYAELCRDGNRSFALPVSGDPGGNHPGARPCVRR